ncbi:hypothetical protein V8C43DRAFT_294248 [Trichoderma afarasin]
MCRDLSFGFALSGQVRSGSGQARSGFVAFRPPTGSRIEGGRRKKKRTRLELRKNISTRNTAEPRSHRATETPEPVDFPCYCRTARTTRTLAQTTDSTPEPKSRQQAAGPVQGSPQVPPPIPDRPR